MSSINSNLAPEEQCRRNINELVKLIDSTYDSYCRKATWSKLQGLFRLAFEMGYEYGRKSIFESRSFK